MTSNSSKCVCAVLRFIFLPVECRIPTVSNANYTTFGRFLLRIPCSRGEKGAFERKKQAQQFPVNNRSPLTCQVKMCDAEHSGGKVRIVANNVNLR